MEKEAKAPTIDLAIQHYWGLRAEGYSLSNVEELADADNLYRNLLQRCLPGPHLGQKSLDIGCGPGFLAIELAKLGFESTGIDSCAPMLINARENVQGLNVEFLQADAAAARFPHESFDVIASRNVVWNLPNPESAYRQWHRWLKPNGKLIIFDGNHYRYLTDSTRHDRPHRETHKYLGDVDINIMESIAKELPMSRFDRPEYDKEILNSIGFVNIDTIVLRQTGDQIHDFAIICKKDHAD